MIDISKTGEVFLLDPELGRMIVYSTKGSMIRTFSFSLKGSSFIPMCFVVHGEKLLLAEENCVVLASPIDGLIFKYVLERYIVVKLLSLTFRRILDGGVKAPTAICSNPAGREIFVYDRKSAKMTFLSDSGRLLTTISMKTKSDSSGE